MLGPAHNSFRVPQRPSEGVFQSSQHVHDVVQCADDLRLLRQVEGEVSEVRRILLQPAACSDAA